MLDELLAYIDENCIARVPAGSRELPSIDGKGFYRWQFYLRSALLEARFLDMIARTFWDRFSERFARAPFQLAGVESASLPIITALLLEAHRRGHATHAFSIRKTRKEYGLRNIVEGRPANLPVMLVDDLTSPQHKALWHAVNVLQAEGLRLYETCFVIVSKVPRETAGQINTSIGSIAIEHLFDLDDFGLTP